MLRACVHATCTAPHSIIASPDQRVCGHFSTRMGQFKPSNLFFLPFQSHFNPAHSLVSFFALPVLSVLTQPTLSYYLLSSSLHTLHLLSFTSTMATDRLILLLRIELPPLKRRRGLAGSIISTAVSAALIGSAVGLTVYRL